MELPEVPDLDINLENDIQLVELGQAFSIMEMLGKLAAIKKLKKKIFFYIILKLLLSKSVSLVFIERTDRSQLPA